MYRVCWRCAGLLFVLCFLAACEPINQSNIHSSRSVATATGTASLPPDANPVLSVPTQTVATSTAVPSPTSSVVATRTPVARPTSPPPVTVPPGWTSVESQLQRQLFNLINRDRAAQGLPAYILNSTMSNGARQHDLRMAGSCGMNHQCPGEPDPCQRISNEGISWMNCGENIGYSSPNPTLWGGVQQIDQAMINEQPPDDGHRRNLLSASFHRVGVGVYVDARGYVWITEDFAN